MDMIIPEFLKKNDIIAVTAPSDGNSEDIDIIRLERAKDALMSRGMRVIETPDVRNSLNGRSASAKLRAEEFLEAWNCDEVKAVISAKGGDFLMEMLSYLPFEKLAAKPKWFQGYSDNTSIGFILSTKYDIASIYCNNFNDFAMENWHESIRNNWDILCGRSVIQKSFDMYQDGFFKGETGTEGYDLTCPVRWDHINVSGSDNVSKAENEQSSQDDLHMRGRLTGGCLDVILNIVGTRFDNVKEYVKRYADDGILWFFESFSLSSEDIERGLWQLKEAGWFENASGFIFGRPAFFSTTTDTTFNEAILNALGSLGVPIITGADTGHKPPQFTMVNGALCELYYSNGAASMTLKIH